VGPGPCRSTDGGDFNSRSDAQVLGDAPDDCAQVLLSKLVRIAGLEPARVAPLPPQSSVSANSTICAQDVHNEPASHRFLKDFLRTPATGAGPVTNSVRKSSVPYCRRRRKESLISTWQRTRLGLAGRIDQRLLTSSPT